MDCAHVPFFVTTARNKNVIKFKNTKKLPLLFSNKSAIKYLFYTRFMYQRFRVEY